MHISAPNAADRVRLLQYFMEKNKLSLDIWLAGMSDQLWEGMSGAEIENLCKEQAINCSMLSPSGSGDI